MLSSASTENSHRRLPSCSRLTVVFLTTALTALEAIFSGFFGASPPNISQAIIAAAMAMPPAISKSPLFFTLLQLLFFRRCVRGIPTVLEPQPVIRVFFYNFFNNLRHFQSYVIIIGLAVAGVFVVNGVFNNRQMPVIAFLAHNKYRHNRRVKLSGKISPVGVEAILPRNGTKIPS